MMHMLSQLQSGYRVSILCVRLQGLVSGLYVQLDKIARLGFKV